MSQKKHISDEELRQSAPLLFSSKKSDIEAPEAYFDELTESVRAKVESPVLQLTRRPNHRWLWKVAAGISILLGSYFLLSPGAEPNAAQLNEQAFQIDLEKDMDFLLEIDEDILYDVLAEEMSNDANTDEHDARIQFLLDEEVELDDIIEVMNS